VFSSQETLDTSQPPEKKSKSNEELEKSPEDSLKLRKIAKKLSIEKQKTSPQASFDPKSLAPPVVKMKIPKKIPKPSEEQQQKQELQKQKPQKRKRIIRMKILKLLLRFFSFCCV
jgi:hypothetical protein